jgi:hypothetical protein
MLGSRIGLVGHCNMFGFGKKGIVWKKQQRITHCQQRIYTQFVHIKYSVGKFNDDMSCFGFIYHNAISNNKLSTIIWLEVMLISHNSNLFCSLITEMTDQFEDIFF